MSDHLISGVMAVLTAIIGVAIIAIILSKQSDTSNVVNSGANSFASMLGCALSPITGKPCASTGRSLIEDVTSTIKF